MAEPISPDASPFKETPDGLCVRVRLTPNAGHNRVEGVVIDANGHGQLKISVTAVPEKGKANKALLKFLSKEWGAGMRALRLIAGLKDRNKTVLIDGESAVNVKFLKAWLGEQM